VHTYSGTVFQPSVNQQSQRCSATVQRSFHCCSVSKAPLHHPSTMGAARAAPPLCAPFPDLLRDFRRSSASIASHASSVAKCVSEPGGSGAEYPGAAVSSDGNAGEDVPTSRIAIQETVRVFLIGCGYCESIIRNKTQVHSSK
jgi:hypothetical protein